MSRIKEPPLPIPWHRRVLRLVKTVTLLYLVVAVCMAVWQNNLIYLPNREHAAKMLEMAQDEGMVPWKDAAGVTIGWKSASPNAARARNRLVVFHGNSGYALMRTHFCEGFERIAQGGEWQVFLFEYPGFGSRAGELGRASHLKAAQAMLELLRAGDSRPIYLVGESLGSGLACQIAHDDRQIAGLLLITPYMSIREVAAYHYPWLPTTLLVRNQWDNHGLLRCLNRPLAVMLAERDEVVTLRQGQAVFGEASEPKRSWLFRGAGHNTIDYSVAAPWWQEVSDFLLRP